MASINLIKGSDGTGNAATAIVSTLRAPAATTILVNTVDNFPANFYGSMGTPHTFTDPVTGETITVISEATAKDFKGHVDGSNLEIDSFDPGYTDAGSAVGDIIVVRPTTEWANNVASSMAVAHNDDGTFKNDSITSESLFTDNVDPVKRATEYEFDFVASGGVWSGDSYGSTRNASMTALVCYINGQRGTISAVTARNFTASKDTYIDVLNTSGVFTLVYTEVTNDAASPSLASNSIRIGIIVTGASNIANVGSVNQGQPDKVLPIASLVPYTTTDSLGNLICPRDPSRRILGYRQITVDSTTGSTTFVQSAGLTVPVIRPTGRKVRVSMVSRALYSVGGSTPYTGAALFETSVAGTQFAEVVQHNPVSSSGGSINMSGLAPDGSGSKVYCTGLRTTSGTAGINANPAYPAFILVELI